MRRIRERVRSWSRRKRIIVAGLIVLPILGAASAELTSQSWFCDSCHIMGPYYDSWRQGTHKDVACVKCHIAPGMDNFVAAKLNGLGQVVDDLLHRTSTKPSASVDELACTRAGCHAVETIRKTEKTDGPYTFRHDKHMDLTYAGIRVACSTCHSHVKGNEHFEVNTDVCLACHLVERDKLAGVPGNGSAAVVIRMAVRESRPAVASDAPVPARAAPATGGAPALTLAAGKTPSSSCTACHAAPTRVIERNGLKIDHTQYLAYGAACESCHRGATATPEPIADGRCLQCHTFGVERSLPTEEMHRIHNEGHHKIECFSCHGTVKHGPVAQSASLEQFDCRLCHQDQHGVQRSTYLLDPARLAASGAPPHASAGATAMSPMFLAHVDCAGCHIKDRPVSANPRSGATVKAASHEACDACHKPGRGQQMIPLWQKAARALYDEAAADLGLAEADASIPAASLDEARRLLEVVRIDGSWGVHNPAYTQQLLERAKAGIAAARAKGRPA
ncbi:MAG: NapC/NirT family cytochrome c [Phycisphaerales bacterium]